MMSPCQNRQSATSPNCPLMSKLGQRANCNGWRKMSIKFATNNLATRYWLLAVISLTWANMMKSTAGFHAAKTLIQGGIVADVGESAFVVTRVAAPVV